MTGVGEPATIRLVTGVSEPVTEVEREVGISIIETTIIETREATRREDGVARKKVFNLSPFSTLFTHTQSKILFFFVMKIKSESCFKIRSIKLGFKFEVSFFSGIKSN